MTAATVPFSRCPLPAMDTVRCGRADLRRARRCRAHRRGRVDHDGSRNRRGAFRPTRRSAWRTIPPTLGSHQRRPTPAKHREVAARRTSATVRSIVRSSAHPAQISSITLSQTAGIGTLARPVRRLCLSRAGVSNGPALAGSALCLDVAAAQALRIAPSSWRIFRLALPKSVTVVRQRGSVLIVAASPPSTGTRRTVSRSPQLRQDRRVRAVRSEP